MNNFVELFKRNGYIVERFNSNDSFIADNGRLCVPFTVRSDGLACAISFLSCDKEAIKRVYKDSKHIGWMFGLIGQIINLSFIVMAE